MLKDPGRRHQVTRTRRACRGAEGISLSSLTDLSSLAAAAGLDIKMSLGTVAVRENVLTTTRIRTGPVCVERTGREARFVYIAEELAIQVQRAARDLSAMWCGGVVERMARDQERGSP